MPQYGTITNKNMFWEYGELSLLKQFMKPPTSLLKSAYSHCRKKAWSSLKI